MYAPNRRESVTIYAITRNKVARQEMATPAAATSHLETGADTGVGETGAIGRLFNTVWIEPVDTDLAYKTRL